MELKQILKKWNYPELKNIRELCRVLGLFSYYSLYQLLKKDTSYKWTNSQQQAFENLREPFYYIQMLQVQV